MADENVGEKVDQAEEKLGSSNGKSRLSGLKSKDVLLPVAATAAAAAAAGLAAKKGPDVMKMLGSEAGEEAEEIGRKGAEGAKKEIGASGGIAGKAASKLLGGKSGGSGSGGLGGGGSSTGGCGIGDSDARGFVLVALLGLMPRRTRSATRARSANNRSAPS